MKLKSIFINSSLVFIIIIIIVYFVRMSNDYILEYTRDGYNIKESFTKKDSVYNFNIKYGDKNYDIAVYSKYLGNKKLIDKVESISNDEHTCLYMKSDRLDTFPICYRGEESISYNNLDITLYEDFYKYKVLNHNEKKYGNIETYVTLENNYFIWNHYGFSYINKNKDTDIKLFKEENYSDSYSFRVGNYIIIPDYDQKYEFNKFYVINMKSGNKREIILKTNISYNYYYMGEHNGIGYIIDKKERIEYAIDPSRLTIKDVTTSRGMGVVWNDNFEEISMTKLCANEYKFKNHNVYNYYLNESKLYLNYSKEKILIIDLPVSHIISTYKDNVYYIVGSSLYMYNPYYGQIKIMNYSELEFNTGLSIYIY